MPRRFADFENSGDHSYGGVEGGGGTCGNEAKREVGVGGVPFLMRSKVVMLALRGISAEETTEEKRRRMERGRTRNERSICKIV